ncbi:hypothetical protein [Helicobacter macacae]|uniref:Uncharacterized protein n=1 Tax=Helicobacter macacae MIT 99-5501 TaxID=1357400 RepID=V8CC31_9HELI|nr:hypothetical protein [Helicobacter macacae]ETD24924.1 hypothetical protein HMPREF2086_00258 [Helicobacter macacae MIT 99-5501]
MKNNFVILSKLKYLRNILRLKEGEIATLEKLENLGFDSVIVEKESEGIYRIDIMPLRSYEDFIQV